MPQFSLLRLRRHLAPGLACVAVAGYHSGCTPAAHQGASTRKAESAAFAPAAVPAPRLGSGDHAARQSSARADSSVQFALDSRGATLASDGKLWLIARFTVPDGAHIYWENPGESGLATTVRFDAPRGFAVGPVKYPGPQRFRGERDAVSYGYAGTVELVSEVTLPIPPPARAEFTAEAQWLACSTVCAAEHAVAHLTLAPSVNLKQFIAPSLPGPLPEAPAPEQLSATRFVLRAPPNTELIEFFPRRPLDPEERDCANRPDVTGSTLELEFGRAPVLPIDGVLRTRVAGEERFFELSLGAR
jgi:Disulphide bond corrector protein DsbC